jgi:crotonobetainyl-CoA:carnitine CoA-transferase CaiB-like acyl-CoA transferase
MSAARPIAWPTAGPIAGSDGWPVGGLQVVDLSSGLAGAYCAKLLADGGADVVKVEDPGGYPLRRVVECGAPLPAGQDGALFRFLCASSDSVVGDVTFVRALVARADVVVWSSGTSAAGDAACAPRALHDAHPDLVVVALSPFGLDGPWDDRPTTDFTRQALCGGHVQRGTPSRPPLLCGGTPGEWAAGTYGAIGALAARRRVVAGGGGDLVDVAALDALMYSQPLYPVTWFQIAGEPFRPLRSSQLPSVHPTADGWVSLQTTTGQQWLDFCAMIGRDDWLADEQMARGTHRTLHRDEIEPVIDAWTGSRVTAEIVELATAMRIPVAEVGNGATLPHFDHLVDGGWFATNADGFTQPSVPYRLGGGAAPRPFGVAPTVGRDTERHRARVDRTPARTSVRTGGDPPLPLAGIRVLDLTAFWAGPLIGHACAILGAEVIHVESTKQPDGIRCNTTRGMNEPRWWEWCPMFQGSNTNKLDLALELDTQRGRALFLALVAVSDVVIDNFSPRVLEQLGLAQDVLLARNPRLIVVRAPGYGVDGPWRERLAYAPTIEAQAGIAWTTGFPDRGPEPPSGIADALGGAHATFALLLALEHRDRTGAGMFLECPMVGASLNLAAQQVVEHSAYGRLLERLGNRSATCVPQGIYRTADVDPDGTRDRWVAISVADDDQWRTLAAALGVDVELRTDHDALDGHITAWCETRSTDEIVARLSGGGVPCEPVVRAHEHDELPPAVARRLFERIDHPVTGTADYIGAPVRFTRGPVRHHRARSPLLGEHNRDVLTRLLGLADADVDRLHADGIIGEVAVGGVLH